MKADDIFAARLRDCWIKSGIQQKELAIRMGLSPARLNAYLRGNVEPPIDILRRLCSEFGVSSDYLIGLTDVASQSVHAARDPLTDLTPDQRTVVETTLAAFRAQNAAAASKQEA